MDNIIAYQLFHIFVAQKFSVLRFNFRGVGKSSGVFDHGVGELLDAADALDWLQSLNPEASTCWLAGFGFGSWIALQLLMRRPEIESFVCVSPPANMYDFSFLASCPINGLIVHGSEDKVTSENSVYELYNSLDKQRNANVEYGLIYGTGHLFENKLDKFKELIHSYLKANVTRDYVPHKKNKKRDKRRKLKEEQLD